MKKKTKLILLSLLLLILGIALLTVSLVFSRQEAYSWSFAPSDNCQIIDINLINASVEICEADNTCVEVIGYRKNTLSVYEEDGKMILADQDSLAFAARLEGVGSFLKSLFSPPEEAKVILYLSREQSEHPVNIVLHDSSLLLASSLEYMTVHAENSTVDLSPTSFMHLDLDLIECQTRLILPYGEDAFSCEVETHATALSVNGDTRANAVFFTSSDCAALLTVHADGGSCAIEYPTFYD